MGQRLSGTHDGGTCQCRMRSYAHSSWETHQVHYLHTGARVTTSHRSSTGRFILVGIRRVFRGSANRVIFISTCCVGLQKGRSVLALAAPQRSSIFPDPFHEGAGATVECRNSAVRQTALPQLTVAAGGGGGALPRRDHQAEQSARRWRRSGATPCSQPERPDLLFVRWTRHYHRTSQQEGVAHLDGFRGRQLC